MAKKQQNQPETQPEKQDDVLFEALQRSKKRRKRRIWITVISIILVLAIGLTATVLYLRSRVRQEFASSDEEVSTYEASTGSISTTVSGYGTLQDVDLQELTVPANVEVEEIKVNANESIEEGDIVATIDSASVLSAMAEVQAELDAFDEQLAEAEDDAVSSGISAGVSGRVMEIYAEEEMLVSDCMYENGALMLLSTDGYLKAEIEAGALAEGDSIKAVLSDGSEVETEVGSISGSTAVILVDDADAANAEEVTFCDAEGAELGKAALEIRNPLNITGYAGTVDSVNVSVGDKVSASTKVLTLTDTDYSANYEAVLLQRQEKEEELLALLKLQHDGALLSPISGSVSSVADLDSETEETSDAAEQIIATLSPDESMSITISVDETDILSLALEQTVQISIDSIGEDIFQGYVSKIDKTATSSSGVTSYSAEILLEKTEQMLAGMSASAVIRIEGVDNAILIPIEALHQTSSTSFVYTSYDEETQEFGGMVEVTTGLSNSSYVEITSGLSVGDVVYYTESAASSFFGGRGGMGGFGGFGGMSEGGGMPSFGGGEMPDFSGGEMPDFGGGGGMPDFSSGGMPDFAGGGMPSGGGGMPGGGMRPGG